MTDNNEQQKAKNDDRNVEWTFDFANLGDSIKGVFDSLAGDEEVHESEFFVSKDGVESARVEVSFAAGRNFINKTDSEHLVAAHLVHVGEVELSEEGDATKTVIIKQKSTQKDVATPFKQGIRAIKDNDQIEWNIGLAEGLPLSLKVNGGVGPTKIDLTDLTVRNLRFDAGVGQFTVILPSQDDEIDLDMNTGVGQSKIYIPDNINANVDIKAGVGSVDVTIPPNTAVQIRAKNGIGSLKVPNSLRRMDKKKEFMDMSGVWQSEGFDLAERRLIIRYQGGVGSFTVTEAELV